jgi:Sulfotransferase family
MDLDPSPRTARPGVLDPAVVIVSVELADTGLVDPLLWFGIDQPATGGDSAGYEFVASGWVLHGERCAEAVQVVGDDGAIVGWGRIGHDRPDLGSAFPDMPRAARCGFQFAVGAIALQGDFTCTIEAILDDGRRVPLALVRGRRGAIPAPENGMLQPVLVSSLGRSGSTLLLGLLAAHPGIVVDRIAPYETRTSSYWLHAFQVLSKPADHEHAGDLATFVRNAHSVGQNPFDMARRGEAAEMRVWYSRTQVERVAAFCRGSIDSYYRTLAKANGQMNPAFFAEKRLTNVLFNPLGELYPHGREIFLVRDFRDVVASIFAFNAQRGYQAFGRQHFASDEDYIKRLALWARQLRDGWRRRAGNSLLVRYEDLALTPGRTLEAVLVYLGFDPGKEVIESMTSYAHTAPEVPGHKTSIDAEHSIGKWQEELDEHLKEVCAAEFGDLLAEFGYEAPPARIP